MFHPMNTYRLHILKSETIFRLLLILAFFILSFLSVAISGYGRTREMPAETGATEIIED